LAIFVLKGYDTLVKGVIFAPLSHLPARVGPGLESGGADQQRERERDAGVFIR
jgi:hypothetical protein